MRKKGREMFKKYEKYYHFVTKQAINRVLLEWQLYKSLLQLST